MFVFNNQFFCLIIGLIVLVVYSGFPYFISWLYLPKGKVFSPINYSHFVSSDYRFYISGVKSARNSFFRHKHPCSNKLGNLLIDVTRFSSYRIAAIFGLFFKDVRWVFLSSYLMSIIISFSLLFWVVNVFINHAFLAIAASLFIFFYFRLFHQLNYLSERKLIFSFFKELVLNKNGNFYIERVNDNFRYLVTSVSNIFIWLAVIFGLSFIQYATFPIFQLGLIIFLISSVFSYPPTALFSWLFFFIISFSGIFYFSEWQLVTYLLIPLGIVLLLLFFFKFPALLNKIRSSNNQVLNDSHVKGEIEKRSKWKLIKSLFFNLKILSTLIIGIYNLLFFQDSVLSFQIGILLILFFFIDLFKVLLNNTNLHQRLYYRGGEVLHFAIICVGILGIIMVHLNEEMILLVSSLLISSVLLFFIGAYSSSLFLKNKGSYYFDKEDLELMEYLKSMDWKRPIFSTNSPFFLQLAPVFLNCNLWLIGAEWLENPNKELDKLCYLIKKFNWDLEYIESFLCDFNVNDFNSSPAIHFDERKFEFYHLLKTILFFPFVKNISITRILDNSGYFTDEFKKLFLHKMDNLNIVEDDWDYFVFKKNTLYNPIPQKNNVIFSNEKYLVLGKNRILDWFES